MYLFIYININSFYP